MTDPLTTRPPSLPGSMDRRHFSRLALGGSVALAVGAVPVPAAAYTQKPAPQPGPTAQDYYDYARKLAGSDPVAQAIEASLTPGFRPPLDLPAPPPTWIFDNVAVIGMGWVSAMVITTSEGLILIDALNNSAEVESILIPGLSELGLDASQIKYVMITHGHRDHFGGARLLADRYGARICMSEADWRLVAENPEAPKRDVVVEDGQRLTLGDTSVHVHLTPGHTPGSASLIVPVRHAGKKHTASVWGGTNTPQAVEDLEDYVASAVRFRQVMRRAHSDVEISPHPFCDWGIERMAQIRAAGSPPGGAPGKSASNPFVLGRRRTQNYMAVLEYMARGRLIDAGGAVPTLHPSQHNGCC